MVFFFFCFLYYPLRQAPFFSTVPKVRTLGAWGPVVLTGVPQTPATLEGQELRGDVSPWPGPPALAPRNRTGCKGS